MQPMAYLEESHIAVGVEAGVGEAVRRVGELVAEGRHRAGRGLQGPQGRGSFSTRRGVQATMESTYIHRI